MDSRERRGDVITYQDFERAENRLEFMAAAIQRHMASRDYKVAEAADLYDRQRNVTINQVVKLYSGMPDWEASNHRIASNFFNRLNTQRCAYLLGNGVSFTRKETRINGQGVAVDVDVVKERLGPRFDTALMEWGYLALIHGVAFGFWNYDRLLVYPLTQFVPIWDARTGALRAGIRFWRLETDRPLEVELYEEDGYTVYESPEGAKGWQLLEIEPKRPYVQTVKRTPADGNVGIEWRNYPGLPVVPMWGSRLRQSTLVGMRGGIDAYDLIQSGFANDLEDCAQIYWLIQNAGGMSQDDLKAFLDDIKYRHVAQVDTTGFDGEPRGALSPYVQDVPYLGRGAYLDRARAQLYEDFGALDVHALSAGSTNDHIDAAYQPMDEQADLFEYQVIEAVQGVLRLMGIEDVPQFRRNRISNVKEQIEAVMLEAEYLDEETVLELLPNITVDMRNGILARRYAATLDRMRDDDGGAEGAPGGRKGASEGANDGAEDEP